MSAFCFNNVILVNVKTVEKNDKVFVFLTVMDMETYTQATLFYFGKSSVAVLEMLKGSYVNCVLEPSAKGFNCIDVTRSEAKAS